MLDVTTTQNRMTIGIDLGDRFGQLCVLDETGETIEEGRLAMTETAVRQRFGSMPRARVAIEAGTHSPWVHALLTGLRVRVPSRGMSGVSIGVPDDPHFIGATLCAQGLLVQYPVLARLTNVTADVVIR